MAYSGLGAQLSLQTSARLPSVQLTAQPAQLRVQAPVLAPEVVSRPVTDAVVPEGDPAAVEPLVAEPFRPWYRSPLVVVGAVGAVGALAFVLWRRNR